MCYQNVYMFPYVFHMHVHMEKLRIVFDNVFYIIKFNFKLIAKLS
jgi:hypothetical protein